MKLNLYKALSATFIVSMIISFSSCQNDEFDTTSNEGTKVETTPRVQTEELPEISSEDLADIRQSLIDNGYDLSEIKEVYDSTTTTKCLANLTLRAIKVSCLTDHPDNSGRKIPVSGVLLVPKRTIFNSFKSYQMLVVPPPTYTANSQSPSELFKKGINLVNIDWKSPLSIDVNMFAAFALQAASGYAVLFPDYPGFGDSFQRATIPYLETKPLMSSTIDLIKAGRLTLSANGYRYKRNLAITGYSQGAFVATSLARELELNKSHGLKVDLLISGGTPCNLKQIVDIVRNSTKTNDTFFLPYALWAYKENGYPYINVKDVLNEPYASILPKVFDGTETNPGQYFPHEVSRLYSKKFIQELDIDPNMAYINAILNENSIKPWRNKCKMVMTHGVSDVSVYYQNARDFADQMKKVGGRVTFYNTYGTHIESIVPYFLKASIYLGLN